MAVELREGWSDDVEVFEVVRKMRKAAESKDGDLVIMCKLDLVRAALGEDGYKELVEELRGEDGRTRVTSLVAWFDEHAGQTVKN